MINVQAKHTRHQEVLERLKRMSHVASERTSSRYQPVNTLEVVETLVDKGFVLQSLSGAYSNQMSAKSSNKHRIEMLNPDLRVDDDTCARIILSNSYDGRSSLKTVVGLFRSACENGLIIGKVGEAQTQSVKHVAGIEDALKQTQLFIDKLPTMVSLIDQYKDVPASDDFMMELALEMACTRQQEIWGSKFDPSNFAVDCATMLEPWRKEDVLKNSWVGFNILQEKVMRGGYTYKPTKTSQMQTAKAIRNPYTQDKINQKIFTQFHDRVVANMI